MHISTRREDENDGDAGMKGMISRVPNFRMERETGMNWDGEQSVCVFLFFLP